MERWTFLVIAGPDEEPAQIRVLFRDGEDPSGWPGAQVALDGSEVPLDDVAHDYEAPEWQAAQLLDPSSGGAGAARVEQIKDGLRARVAS
jgi:hypothetical protein